MSEKYQCVLKTLCSDDSFKPSKVRSYYFNLLLITLTVRLLQTIPDAINSRSLLSLHVSPDLSPNSILYTQISKDRHVVFAARTRIKRLLCELNPNSREKLRSQPWLPGESPVLRKPAVVTTDEFFRSKC